ncbi:MAG: hypothetical protein ACKVOX_03105 [Rhizobacter sp.]
MPPNQPVSPSSDRPPRRPSVDRCSEGRRGALVWVTGVITSLAGCAAYSPSALPRGATAAEVVSIMGPPTGTSQAPQRLEFARGPAGKHTYMVDFDADGRLLAWEQVLTEKNFFLVQAGQTQDEVIRRLGHPSTTFPIGRQHIVVWNYRYETPFCQWFQVSIGTAPDTLGHVTEVGFGPDPRCWSMRE